MRLQRKSAQNKGFSLVEVVIAIGIVAILLTTFMAVFGPAQKNITKALGVADVSRLTSTLENEMSYLRVGEEDEYEDSQGNSNAFQKAFEWVKDSGSESSAIIVYQYHADPSASKNEDGTLAGISSSTSGAVAGVDFVTQTVARKRDSEAKEFIKEELRPGVVVGNVYAVRMTQLVDNAATGGLILGTAGAIKNPNNPNDPAAGSATDGASYTGAHLAFQAEFFLLPNNLAGFVTEAKWDFDKLGSPVVTQNIAVRK